MTATNGTPPEIARAAEEILGGLPQRLDHVLQPWAEQFLEGPHD